MGLRNLLQVGKTCGPTDYTFKDCWHKLSFLAEFYHGGCHFKWLQQGPVLGDK